jgi:hypothetical protein
MRRGQMDRIQAPQHRVTDDFGCRGGVVHAQQRDAGQNDMIAFRSMRCGP